MLPSDWCDFSDAYIAVKRGITVAGNNVAKTRDKELIFKNKLYVDHTYQKPRTHL